jgi:hypothetical protein
MNKYTAKLSCVLFRRLIADWRTHELRPSKSTVSTKGRPPHRPERALNFAEANARLEPRLCSKLPHVPCGERANEIWACQKNYGRQFCFS